MGGATGAGTVGAGKTASGTTAGMGGTSAELVPGAMFVATEIIDLSDLINNVNVFPYTHLV